MLDQDPNLSPDLEWMLQSGQAGESLIVEALVKEFYGPVHRLAFSILDEANLAHRAVVKTFQLALRSTHRYRSETGVKIWLFRLALQVCRRLLPGLAARRALSAVFNPRSAPGPEAPLPHTAEEADLWLAVDALPYRLRLPLLLHDVHGLPVSEIVQVLGAGEEAVRARLKKGRETVRWRSGMPTASDETYSGWLSQGLGARWPGADLSPARLEAARREIENRRDPGSRPQLVFPPLRKLALGGLGLVLMAGIAAASFLLFPGEEGVQLQFGNREAARVVQVKVTATTAAALQPEPQATSQTAPDASLEPLPGIPGGFLLDVPEALIEQTFFDPLDEWANSGPIVLSRVLGFWGRYVPLPELTRALQPNPADENVMPYELVTYVDEETDLKAVLRMAGDFGMLARLVSAGFPVILEKGAEEGETGDWMGHYVIAAGYHQGAQETLILHSSLASNPVSAVKSSALKEDWQPFNYLYLVVYPADKEAELLGILGDQAGAEENYRQALEKASLDMRSVQDMGSYFAWFNRGTSLTYLDDYQGAAEAYDQAAEIYALLPAQQRPDRMLWYQSRPYWAYYYAGRYDDVIRLADETLGAAGDPVLEESYYWRALAREAKGDITGAIADLQESLKLNPNFSAGIYQLSRLQEGS